MKILRTTILLLSLLMLTAVQAGAGTASSLEEAQALSRKSRGPLNVWVRALKGPLGTHGHKP